MAEIVGVVSGAITFATVIPKVIESIATIEDFWSQFRDAPDDLNYLMRDLGLFRLILIEIEETISQEALATTLQGSKLAMESLQYCRQAATGLQTLSAEIARDMNSSSRRRKYFSITKIMMQRPKLERYTTRLRNAIQLLSEFRHSYVMLVLSDILGSFTH